LKLTIERHEASRGYSATAGLLVTTNRLTAAGRPDGDLCLTAATMSAMICSDVLYIARIVAPMNSVVSNHGLQLML